MECVKRFAIFTIARGWRRTTSVTSNEEREKGKGKNGKKREKQRERERGEKRGEETEKK